MNNGHGCWRKLSRHTGSPIPVPSGVGLAMLTAARLAISNTYNTQPHPQNHVPSYFSPTQNADGSQSGAIMKPFVPKLLRVAFSAFLALIVIVLFLRPPFSGSLYYRKSSPPITIENGSLPAEFHPEALEGIDWSRFAYVQYVTNAEYLCNSVMLFEALHRLGSKADRLMMYPSNFAIDSDGGSREAFLLRKAQDVYSVTLVPIEIQRRSGHDG